MVPMNGSTLYHLLRPTWPVLGEVRASTVLMAAVIVAVIAWRRRSLWGVAVMLTWASAYEAIDQGTGVVLHQASLSYFVWTTAAYGGWLVLAWQRRIYPELWLTVLFVGLWAGWVLAGFHANVAGSSFVLRDELFNEATKTVLGVAFLAGALRLGVSDRADGAASLRGVTVVEAERGVSR